MKYFLIITFTIGIGVFDVFSQDITKEIGEKIGKKINSYGFTKKGNFYFAYLKDKSFPKKQRGTVEFFDENLELEFSHDCGTKFFVSKISNKGDQIMSEHGRSNAYTSDYIFLNNEGEEINYKSNGYKTFKFIPKGYVVKDKYVIKDSLFLFTYDKRSKEKTGSKKNKYTYSYNIIKLSLKTGKYDIVDFDMPKLNSSKKYIKFFPLKNFNNNANHSFLVKEFLGDLDREKKASSRVLNYSEQKMFIVNYDEHFRYVDTNELKMSLDEVTKLFFSYSNHSESSYDIHSRTKPDGKISNYVLPEDPASGYVFKDSRKNFYTYSILSSDSKKEEKGGVYINKFDSKGVFLWKKMISIPKDNDKMPLNGSYAYLKISELDDSLIISYLNIYHKYRFNCISLLNKENGALTNQETFSKLKFNDSNKSVPNVKAIINPSLYASKAKKASSIYKIEEYFGELIVDETTIMAYVANENFKKFIEESKAKNEEIHFITHINSNYIFTFEINKKSEKYKLHRFDF